jgi:hypothetical protein
MLVSLLLNLFVLNSIYKNNNLILAQEVTNNSSCDFIVKNNNDFPSYEMIVERGCYEYFGSSYEGYYYDSEKKYGTAHVIISSNVTKIKEFAFKDCGFFAIANVSFEKPSSLKVIENNAFYGCYSIESITIPSSVEVIGDYAFFNTNRLKHVYFENDTNIQKIGKCALPSSVVIPISVNSHAKEIIESVIEECGDFYYNIDDNQNDVFMIETNNSNCEFFVNSNDDFPSCVILEERNCYEYNDLYNNKYGIAKLIVSKDVTIIKQHAFENCFALSNVTFLEPSSLKVIEEYAFNWCDFLETITIPSSVIVIEDYAFANTNRLKNITFENKEDLISIGKGAFSCFLVNNFYFPPLTENVFENCDEMIYDAPKHNYLKKEVADNTSVYVLEPDKYNVGGLEYTSDDYNIYLYFLEKVFNFTIFFEGPFKRLRQNK